LWSGVAWLVTLAVWRLPLPGRHRYDPGLSIQSSHSRTTRAPARRTPARRATIPGMHIPRLAREAGPARGRRGEGCGSRPEGRQVLPAANPSEPERSRGGSRLGGGAPGPALVQTPIRDACTVIRRSGADPDPGRRRPHPHRPLAVAEPPTAPRSGTGGSPCRGAL